MTTAAAHPIKTLREHATALEAAFSVCLAKPTPEAVHRLRSETRRIEAQLALLALIPGLPSHRAAARQIEKRMQKLRHMAGEVRDLDVQLKLIKDEVPKVRGKAKQEEALRDGKAMLKRRRQLREERAQKLVRLIEKRGPKLSAALEGVLSALEPREGFRIAPTALLDVIDRGFRRESALGRRNPSDDQLHAIRKAAKVARYQAENATGSKTAKMAAKRYEAIQAHGGQWHDWMGLADAAGSELGPDHGIAARFATLRDRHLVTYRGRLDGLRDAPVRNGTKPGAKQKREPAADKSGANRLSTEPRENKQHKREENAQQQRRAKRREEGPVAAAKDHIARQASHTQAQPLEAQEQQAHRHQHQAHANQDASHVFVGDPTPNQTSGASSLSGLPL
jgi:CHAD domain-containing protein